MNFSEFLLDYADKFYTKPSEMLNIVYIVIAIFVGFVAISDSIDKFPDFLSKEVVLIILLLLMLGGMKGVQYSGNRTNKIVIAIKNLIILNPNHIDNLNKELRKELLNQLDLVFTKRNMLWSCKKWDDTDEFKKCKSILEENITKK